MVICPQCMSWILLDPFPVFCCCAQNSSQLSENHLEIRGLLDPQSSDACWLTSGFLLHQSCFYPTLELWMTGHTHSYHQVHGPHGGLALFWCCPWVFGCVALVSQYCPHCYPLDRKDEDKDPVRFLDYATSDSDTIVIPESPRRFFNSVGEDVLVKLHPLLPS